MGAGTFPQEARMDRPNILLMTTHDTGRHIGCYGVTTVRTENIDSLASQGTMFRNYFCASPMCSPSRGAMMTGRYPQTNGMMGLCHAVWGWSLNEPRRHLSWLLREAGYDTALIGHQHETNEPERLGFDEIHVPPGTGETHWHPGCHKVSAGFRDYLENRRGTDTPFYAQVGFFETHRHFDFATARADTGRGVYVPPYMVPSQELHDDLALFQGAIRDMDSAVGEILEALAEAGLAENTLVVWTTDHGIPYMARAKGTLYDPGTGIGLVMRLPGRIPQAQACDWLLENVDLVPTVLELAGVGAPEGLEGGSFAGCFRGEGQSPRDAVFTEHTAVGKQNDCRAVRTERYKLIRNFGPHRQPVPPAEWPEPTEQRNAPYVELYDLQEDPYEFDNRADDPALAEVRADLERRLWQWMEQVDDPLLHGPVVTPYYQSAMEDFRAETGS
jgi:arylsulfatase A-like enzyme